MSMKIVVPDDFPVVLTGSPAEQRLRTLGAGEIRARFAEVRQLAHFDDLEVDPFADAPSAG